MLTNLAFTVPGTPQGKGRARVGKGPGGHARMFTPSATVAYEGLVAYAAQTAMRGSALILGACSVELEAVFAVPASASKRARADALEGRAWPAKKPDGDNIVKAVFDGMNGVVWKDDVQAVDFRCVKRYGLTPGVWVRVAVL